MHNVAKGLIIMTPTAFAITYPIRPSAMIPGLIPVDVVTTDSRHYVRDACMVEALHELDPMVAELLDYHEWSLCTKEGYDRACSFHTGATPTVYINGKKLFENIVPTVGQLYEALLREARTQPQKKAINDAWSHAEHVYAEAA